MNNSGVTLIELIVVVSIIGILSVALGFSYVGWQGAYKVESAIKQLYSDLLIAQSTAVTRSLNYFVVFPASPAALDRYWIIEDTNDNGQPNPGAGDTILATFPKMFSYPVNWTHGYITFGKRGVMSTEVTPYLGGTFRFITTANADYDCLRISQTRILMGKWNGTTSVCDVK